ITATGFEPAVVNAEPGDVVMWVNADLSEHATVSASWDSGLLDMGASYKVRLADIGTFDYRDGENGLLVGTIVVEETLGGSDDMQSIFLPLVSN
ncbi:hypothetical protein KC957_02795, partial [Candidatus Saccharibacteria bacterium]|nr:hypothetical protein [Candidatus Saccharibacteria bacterium]